MNDDQIKRIIVAIEKIADSQERIARVQEETAALSRKALERMEAAAEAAPLPTSPVPPVQTGYPRRVR